MPCIFGSVRAVRALSSRRPETPLRIFRSTGGWKACSTALDGHVRKGVSPVTGPAPKSGPGEAGHRATAACGDDDDVGLDSHSFTDGDGGLRRQLAATRMRNENNAICGTDPFMIFDIRPGITPVRPKARADFPSDFAEGDVIGVELCLF